MGTGFVLVSIECFIRKRALTLSLYCELLTEKKCISHNIIGKTTDEFRTSGSDCETRASLKIREWVLMHTAAPNLKVEMCSRATTRTPHLSNDIAALYGLTDLDLYE